MDVSEYLESLGQGDYVAVAKGRCDCGNPKPHSQYVEEFVKQVDQFFVETTGGVYSRMSGMDLTKEEHDGEFWGIRDPRVNVEAEYILLEGKAFRLKNSLGIDGFIDTDELLLGEVDEINEKLDKLALIIYNQSLNDLTWVPSEES